MNAEMMRAKHVGTHLNVDLHNCLYDRSFSKRHNTKENHRKVPSRREAVIKCEILQSAMIQAQGKWNHEEREPSLDVGRKEKCIVGCRWQRWPCLQEWHSQQDPMAGNGMGKNGGKYNKQVFLGNGASSIAPPIFRVSNFVYSWSVLWRNAFLIASRHNNF